MSFNISAARKAGTQCLRALWPRPRLRSPHEPSAHISFHFTYKERPLTELEYIDYLHAILFRYVLGISDLADRNFLMTGRVISIDEDVEGRVMDLYATLQKNRATFLHKWLQNGYENLSVVQWVVDDPFQQDRLREIQSKDLCLALFHPHD